MMPPFPFNDLVSISGNTGIFSHNASFFSQCDAHGVSKGQQGGGHRRKVLPPVASTTGTDDHRKMGGPLFKFLNVSQRDG